MHRRTLILSGAAALAGCANGAPEVVPARIPTERSPAPPPTPPSTPPPPPPPAPPENAAFLAIPEPAMTPSGDARFDAWRAQVIELWGPGWRPYLVRLLADLRPIVVEPEPAPPTGAEAAFYVRAILTPERIAEGRRRSAEPWLQAIARRAGVPAEILAAAWGASTNYGREQGRYDLLAFWATRAAVGDGYRDPDFGEAARIVVAGGAPRTVMRCFADGGFGQLRWFPRQHAEWAVDGDGDGAIDPWRSAGDAVGSAANWLGRGWGPGGWVAEILLPDYADPRNQRLWEGVRRGGSVRPDYVLRADGRPWSPEDAAGSGQVIQPSGEAGPTLLTLRNFAPLRYLHGNHMGRFAGSEPRAVGWALAAGLLASAIRGDPPLSRQL